MLCRRYIIIGEVTALGQFPQALIFLKLLTRLTITSENKGSITLFLRQVPTQPNTLSRPLLTQGARRLRESDPFPFCFYRSHFLMKLSRHLCGRPMANIIQLQPMDLTQ
jgi:hypothetical protein